MSVLIAPSILSADFLHLADSLAMIEKSEADWIHVDIMDGVFVPNISFGFPVLEAVRQVSTKPLDVHLMITEAERYVERFAKAGARSISVHLEGSLHPHRTLQQIRELGCLAGLAVNPGTPIAATEDLLELVDVVCLMGVNPGFGGQKYIPRTTRRIAQLHQLINHQGLKTLIEIDGGVTTANAAELVAAGADVLVAGNAVFAATDPSAAIRSLKSV